MKVFLRHFFIALLPLAFGVGAGWAFAFSVPTCGRLVGPVFAPKCHWMQLEYYIQFQVAGTALGCLIATILGTWLELRRRRAVQRSDSNQGGPS
ncbi:MAG TPA: hypothetical protein VGQ06_08720 [Gemmatimonadales bacterium]|jgi:hypothetical protein|nr:hypothetical protein [Gemmatimonadales bacterium]